MKRFLFTTPLLAAGFAIVLWSENKPTDLKAADPVTPRTEEVPPKKLAAEKLPPVKPQCELRLELGTKMEIGKGEAKIQLRNVGNTPMTLVMPGDGSDCGWRTPIIGWSVLPVDSDDDHPPTPPRQGVGRCGNINSLKAEEVFTLRPGQSKTLGPWARLPTYNLKPGKYRVVVYYKNDPKLKWSGLPLGPHDQKAMQRIGESTPVNLVSNEQIIELVE